MLKSKAITGYKNIVFDLDGTLSDPRQGIYNGIRHALTKMGVTYNPDHDFSHFIGAPLQDSFRAHYFDDHDKAWMAVESFREYYSQHGLYENELYCGIDALIAELATHYHLYVLTNKPKIFANKILKNFKLDHYFTAIEGVDVGRTNESKDDLAPGLMAQHSSFAMGPTLMVGDTAYDIACARKNGWDVLAVTYGFGKHTELAQLSPTLLIHTVAELKSVLL